MEAPPPFFGYLIFATLVSRALLATRGDGMTLLLHLRLVSCGDPLFSPPLFFVLFCCSDWSTVERTGNGWSLLYFVFSFQFGLFTLGPSHARPVDTTPTRGSRCALTQVHLYASRSHSSSPSSE
ncbi:hypothetical protein BDV98DRAFT_427981 [Pterulicium gracile]|uniref:Secreted protein n=1 Tax=Pterulicium gracile TaxID=1884261 RepID=A0A5C3QQ73_9AGAR|nr:hypothetical protein BDV98DRAFT_427981 [Pterula gracilis]